MPPKKSSSAKGIRTKGTPLGAVTAISVIVPTKNEEKLLEQCLQQFSAPIRARFNLEVIVSDGGSSDNTLGIAAAYADFIATHIADHRQTIAEGRNRGAQLANAQLLIFINADTRFENTANFLERARQRFAVDQALAALASRVEVMPEERILSDKLFHGFFNRYVHLLNVIGLGMGRGECQIVRREAFEALRGYNNLMVAGEDFDLFKRLRSIGRVRYDHALLIFESPRRYRKYGYARVYFDWIRNGFAVLFKNKSVSQTWEEVR
ncbi:MAG: glycosyltransferase [Candidatus Kapaibacterium sp.]|jgi:glycosyltransferase involved in cell wall biosynthesis